MDKELFHMNLLPFSVVVNVKKHFYLQTPKQTKQQQQNNRKTLATYQLFYFEVLEITVGLVLLFTKLKRPSIMVSALYMNKQRQWKMAH